MARIDFQESKLFKDEIMLQIDNFDCIANKLWGCEINPFKNKSLTCLPNTKMPLQTWIVALEI